MLTVFISAAYRNCKIYFLPYSVLQMGMCSRIYEQIINLPLEKYRERITEYNLLVFVKQCI